MSTSLVVAEKAHATLGASSAKRWMECPGSVAASAGIPDTASHFAEEGTAAHALAELALARGADPHAYLGTTVAGHEVTEEMADHVQVYTRHVEELRQRCSQSWIERRFSLAALNPPAPMFGTADFVGLDAATRTLYVSDLKYGVGVVVEAGDNPQLLYYALGAVLSLPPELQGQIDHVRMTIVQPRAAHPEGLVRSVQVDYLRLVEFGAALLEAAARTQDPAAPRVPGEWCRFCRAAARCPEQRNLVQSLAQMEFDAHPLDVPRPPALLTPDELVTVLRAAPAIESWLKDVRRHAMAELAQGRPIPGHKLVAGRATRRWTDEGATTRFLEARGVGPDEYERRELKSVAQIEKLIGRKALPTALVESRVSGFSIAPEHDRRPAVALDAGSEFAALPLATEDL